MNSNRRIIYEFGRFRLDSVRRLLARDGEAVPLTPKTFDLLLTLVQNRGQILAREELLHRIWPRTVVEESNLTQNIFVLRKALGETPGDHFFIVTVPGRGYRFVAPVRELEEEGARAEWAEAGNGPQQGAVTIAVLPLKSIDRQAGEEYWGPGLAGSLINRLNRLRAIAARPITSVLRYADTSRSPQDAGRELGVSAVLDGTVQRAGESIRVNVELIRVGDGVTLWAGQFDDRLTDIFGTQDAIAEQVARALSVELTGEERGRLRSRDTDDGEAYRLYIKGRFFWEQRTRRGLLRGAGYAERALALDPNYARAYVGVADSYLLLGEYLHLPPAEAFPRAKGAALRALELDDSLAEAHASLAEALFFNEWDWPQAEGEYQRACELNPRYASAHHWYAWFLLAQERFDEALDEISLAQKLDPGSLTLATATGLPFYFRGEYEQAEERYREALEMEPDFTLAHYYLGLALLQLGRYAEAISSLRKVRAVDYQQQVTAQLGRAYACAGRRAEALAVLRELRAMRRRGYVSPYMEAMVYAALGEKEEAAGWLERAHGERAPWMVFLRVEPCFDALRPEPRFRRLVEQLWG
ncbi:MAG: winged helix-turn-helix domain-containing protein [Acidobacteria bacterium]|nr:winged helix-turn-helix domain-containing protein [Acidobacteriota bacterium]